MNPKFLRQSAYDDGKVVVPTHRHPDISSVDISVSSTVRKEGFLSTKKKIPMTPSGIEPATFRLEAQCLQTGCTTALMHQVTLNHQSLATCVHQDFQFCQHSPKIITTFIFSFTNGDVTQNCLLPVSEFAYKNYL